jgi:hypothetical protein
MYCPQCGAEYRPNFTVCSDCQVALVPDQPDKPPQASAAAANDSFALVWSGANPQEHARVLEVLDRWNIDARTVSGEEHPIFANTHPGFEVYVPAALKARADEVLKDLNEPSQDESEQMLDSPALELPAEDDAPDDDDDDDTHRRETDWHPDDATVEIWAGEDQELADMIAMSLRENQIGYRNGSALDDESAETQASNAPDETSPAEPAIARLFVLPEDEARAKEIVSEIINAKPL